MEIYLVVNFMNFVNDKFCRNFYKECSDDDYDYFGENVREEVEEEDNYYYVFFFSNEDEVDYGICIRNIFVKCLMENLYSYMNIGDYYVILEDNEYNIIFINV